MHYSETELTQMGLKFGKEVKIHKTVQIIGGTNISIGNNVRIDAFSILSANKPVVFGNFIHIAAGVYIFGSEGATFEDYSGISTQCSVFTGTEDYKNGFFSNPTVPNEFRKVRRGPVTLGKFCVVGSGSVILPNVRLGVGCSVGALTLISRDVEDFAIMSGNPAKKIGERNKEQLLFLEEEHKKQLQK